MEAKIMNTETISNLNCAIKTLERKNRWLTLIVFCLFVIGVVPFLIQTVFKAHSSDSLSQDKILRVRGIVVVDENGTERVWIGAPVPEPLILGKRFPRGGRMSGIILFDEEGNERSGYCTSDGYPNVLFTLDSIGRQHVLFLSEPQGDTTLRLWNGGNSFNLNIGEEESSLKLSQKGEVLFEVPPTGLDEKGEIK
jgi:hypothetical protein